MSSAQLQTAARKAVLAKTGRLCLEPTRSTLREPPSSNGYRSQAKISHRRCTPFGIDLSFLLPRQARSGPSTC